MTITTTAPLSEVAIANMAIDILADQPITSLGDSTVVGRWMARNFGRVRDEVLEMYPWNGVKTRVALAADSAPPTFGWKYQYTVPADCITLLPLRYGGALNGALIPYEFESGKILTDASAPLLVRYIRRETNVAKWTALQARILASRLAFIASLTINGKAQYSQKAEKLLTDAIETSKLGDTLASGTPEQQTIQDIIAIRGVGL